MKQLLFPVFVAMPTASSQLEYATNPTTIIFLSSNLCQLKLIVCNLFVTILYSSSAAAAATTTRLQWDDAVIIHFLLVSVSSFWEAATSRHVLTTYCIQHRRKG